MTWHKDYTKAEIENVLTNMCSFIGEHLDMHYNFLLSKIPDKHRCIYVDMGLHENEVRSWYMFFDD